MMDVQSQQMQDKGQKHGYVWFFNNHEKNLMYGISACENW